MTKERLGDVIGFDDKGLTPANHCYNRIVARWLEVLASYIGQPSLTVITSRIVLETIEGSIVYLETQIGNRLSSLDPKNV